MAPPLITLSPDPVSVGGTVRICFTDSSKAEGTSVQIDLENGRTPPTTVSVQVTLDGDGHGCVDWPVPTNWGEFVIASHPDSASAVVDVTP
jgi:hypothetical protein